MKYEYVLKKDLNIKDINLLGEEGWELCAVRGTDVSGLSMSVVFYFKRLIV